MLAHGFKKGQRSLQIHIFCCLVFVAAWHWTFLVLDTGPPTRSLYPLSIFGLSLGLLTNTNWKIIGIMLVHRFKKGQGSLQIHRFLFFGFVAAWHWTFLVHDIGPPTRSHYPLSIFGLSLGLLTNTSWKIVGTMMAHRFKEGQRSCPIPIFYLVDFVVAWRQTFLILDTAPLIRYPIIHWFHP